MKKTITIILATLLMILGVTSIAAAENGQKLTLEQAKQIALDRVGVKEAEAVFTKAHLDRDDGRLVYEIEFHVGNIEYDMDVDAYTGAITDFSQDYEAFYGKDGTFSYEYSYRYDDHDDFDLDDIFDFD